MAKRRSGDLSSILAPLADIVNRLKVRRNELAEDLSLVDAELARFDGSGNGRASRKSATRVSSNGAGSVRRKRKRIRRSREQIEAVARDIVKFIQDGGKDGRGGRDIKAKFGAILPSTKAFLKEYAPNAKLKTTGLKATMRYHGG